MVCLGDEQRPFFSQFLKTTDEVFYSLYKSTYSFDVYEKIVPLFVIDFNLLEDHFNFNQIITCQNFMLNVQFCVCVYMCVLVAQSCLLLFVTP